MEYLIADLHFGHKKIIEFEPSRRHFSSIEEMDEALIQKWNETVHYNDIVYILGDISMNSKYNYLTAIFSRLKGKKIVIQGNHDNTSDLKKLLRDGYIEAYHDLGIRLKRNKQKLYLSHYPMFIGRRENMWSVHGHIHSLPSVEPNQLNVGVDASFMRNTMGLDFGEPILLDALVDYMVAHPVPLYPRREEV